MTEAGVYWKNVAFRLADMMAATAEHQLSLKSTGAGEKARHTQIMNEVLVALQGSSPKMARRDDVIIARVEGVISEGQAMLVKPTPGLKSAP